MTLPAGTKLDADKPRWGLLPFDALADVVAVLTFGARKYAPGNWRLVQGANDRYFDAAMRHLVAWRLGDRVDSESGLPHLAHAACCLLFVLALDRPATAIKGAESALVRGDSVNTGETARGAGAVGISTEGL